MGGDGGGGDLYYLSFIIILERESERIRAGARGTDLEGHVS